MIHCAVCDDDKSVTGYLHNLLNVYSAELECSTFGDPLILRSAVCSGQMFDFYILDVIMPVLTGIDLAREIHKIDKDSAIIFLTSSDEFHRDAFEVEALQYLGKPVDKAKLYRAIDRVIRYVGEKTNERLPVQTKDGFNNIDISQIVFVESFRHILTFHQHDGATVQTLDSSLSLEKLIETLQFPPFCVPCRGFIANMNYVDCLQKFRLSMSTGDAIPIPQKHFSQVRQQYSDYLLTYYTKGDA